MASAEDLDQITRRTRLSPVMPRRLPTFLFNASTLPRSDSQTVRQRRHGLGVRVTCITCDTPTAARRFGGPLSRLLGAMVDRTHQSQRWYQPGRSQHPQGLLLRFVPLDAVLRHAEENGDDATGTRRAPNRAGIAIDVHAEDGRSPHRQCPSFSPAAPAARSNWRFWPRAGERRRQPHDRN